MSLPKNLRDKVGSPDQNELEAINDQEELDDFLLNDQEECPKIPSSSDMNSLLAPPSGSL